MRHAPEVRVNNFDLLRLLAAGQVVWEHGLEHFLGVQHLPSWDWALQAIPGVPIFFAISGFLISLSFERAKGVGVYLQNRFLRIYPALWACLGVTIISILVFGEVDWSVVGAGDIGKWLAAQVSVGQFYNAPWLRGYGSGVMNGSLWTIPVELQFYLLVPAIYGLLRRIRAEWQGAVLITLTLAFWVVGTAFGQARASDENYLWFKLLGVTFVPYIYLFLIGVLLQRHWKVLGGIFVGSWRWWLVGYLALSAGLHFAGLTVGTNWPHPLSVLPLIGLVFSLAFSNPGLTDKVLRRNDVSYGVYIYHLPVINVFLVLGLTGNEWLTVPVALITVGCAIVSWKFIERPALRMKQRTMHAPVPGLAERA